MADGMTLWLEGADRLNQELMLVAEKVGRDISRRALRAAGNVILPVEKANAQSMVGGAMGSAIAKSLELRVRKGFRSRRGWFAMNIEIGKEDKTDFVHVSRDGTQSFIPTAIEYGHAAPGDAGGHKVVAAIPFGRRAFDSQRVNAVRAAMQVFKTEIPRALRAR